MTFITFIIFFTCAYTEKIGCVLAVRSATCASSLKVTAA